MLICFTVAGKRHCYFIPIFRIPFHIPVGPTPGNYDKLLTDATVLATIADLATQLSDTRVGGAVREGVNSALKAMQAHAGEGIEIRLTTQQS